MKFGRFLVPFVARTFDAAYRPAVGSLLRIDHTARVEHTDDLPDHAPVGTFDAAMPAHARPVVRVDKGDHQRLAQRWLVGFHRQ